MSARRTIPLYVFHPSPSDPATLATGAPEGEGFYLPLALGLIVETARTLSPAVASRYELHAAASFSQEHLLAAVAEHGPGVCLFSSYLWNVGANLDASRAVKALDARCVTVHGGPSTPKHVGAAAAFLAEHPHVDIALRGEGEFATIDLLEGLGDVFEGSASVRANALGNILSITFRDEGGTVVRTAERARLEELGLLSSPYLGGYFDRLLAERAAGGRSTRLAMATLETNRGCPYQCVFCDWGSLTLQKVKTFPLDRVCAELEWIGRHEVRSVFLSDANFGMLTRDADVARAIAETRRRFGFPLHVVANYAKNGSARLAEASELWRAAGVSFEPTLSLQTTDPATLATIRRSNIATEKYLELGDVYRKMGLDPGVQLMMGLPGSTIESWKRDLQFAFDRREHVQIFPTQMLPNSPMAEPDYVALHRLRTDELGTLIETGTFTEEQWRVMGRISCAFLLYSNWGVLRYFLMYLQWDHGVRALDFIHAHAEAIHDDPTGHPLAAALLLPLLAIAPTRLAGTKPHSLGRFYEEGWGGLFREIADFAARKYGVARDEGLAVALTAQEAVMPRRDLSGQRTVELAHDFVRYVVLGREAMLRGERPATRLSGLAEGSLRVVDPRGRQGRFGARSLTDLSGGNPAWELDSSLSGRAA